jgi:hypothetical protein
VRRVAEKRVPVGQKRLRESEGKAANARKLAAKLMDVVESWGPRQQRARAASVSKVDATVVKRKACSILRDWHAERGCLGWSAGSKRLHQLVADVEVRIGSPQQWFRLAVRAAGAGGAQVDDKTTKDWALTVVDGEANVVWSQQGASGCVRVQVVPWSSNNEGLKFPEGWLKEWRDPVAARPEVREDGALVREAALQPALELDEEEVHRWWGEKADAALRELPEGRAAERHAQQVFQAGHARSCMSMWRRGGRQAQAQRSCIGWRMDT